MKTPTMVYAIVHMQLQRLARRITAFGRESRHGGNRPAAASADTRFLDIYGSGTEIALLVDVNPEIVMMTALALHCRRAHEIREEMRMAQSIRNVMSAHPITMPVTSTVAEAARAMREASIGDVIVLEGDQLCGMVTDRDIVVRAVAEGRDPEMATLGDICSREMTTLSPTDEVENAVQLMRDKAIRRVPVVENGAPIGIVSLGDLAVSQDPRSALGHISAAPPNV